ncbi:MAG: CHAT domain-containing protein [Pseudomonadota bacterium]|nr:CHAT domain-containing protein [Pseudomonadota bacterium]
MTENPSRPGQRGRDNGVSRSAPRPTLNPACRCCQAPRLPETADELRAMGKVLQARPGSIWLQERANETLVKNLDLSKYRTIAFATHGLMAGEIEGLGEPGLILTPPRLGTLEDDGYLSAGEIAKLKLNADWVVLSACNTAAADGTPGAEGLSGLSKAFF